MTRISILSATLLLSGATAFPAFAQDATPSTPDQNMSAPPPAADDNNRSGPSHRLTGPAVVFNMMDDDGNGAISMDEARVLFEAIFITIDRDEDGELSKAEINAALQRFYGRDGGRDDGRDGGRGGYRGHGGGHHGDGRK